MAFFTKSADTSDAGDGSLHPELLDVRQTAQLLNASPRTVYRLSDAGKMPSPIKLGALVRWRTCDLEKWIADGCPSCRKVKQSGGAK